MIEEQKQEVYVQKVEKVEVRLERLQTPHLNETGKNIKVKNKFRSEHRCVHRILFGDGTDDSRDGNDLMSPGEPYVGFHLDPSRSSRAYFGCFERKRWDPSTDGRTEGRTKPLIEMRGRI